MSTHHDDRSLLRSSNIAQYARNASADALDRVEAGFRALLARPDLDADVERDPEISSDFERGLEHALRRIASTA